jgi:hypothetical protein
MHDGGWEALLKHIPAEQHNKYMIVTANNTEIAVQSFLRIEKELVVLKGRLAGSQDQGRIFFIPYANIDNFGTAQITKDTDFAEVFDSFTFPVARQAAASADPPQREPQPDAEPEPAAAPTNGNGDGRQPGTGSGVRRIRSEVLERFRNARPSGPSSSDNLPRPPAS